MNTLIVKLYEVHGMTIAQIASHLELTSAYVRAVLRGSV
jgi:DNA-binding transcriptional regulator LsrR (DeoR family)